MNVAIIGLGRIGLEGISSNQPSSHLACYNSLPDVDAIAVCDLNGEKLAKAVASIDKMKKAYQNYHEMMMEFKPDIVSVCTPTPSHKEITCDIAKYPSVKTIFCLPRNTVIYGNPKIECIQDIQPAEKVLSVSGLTEVEKTFKRFYKGPLINIKPFYLPSLRLTPEHMVLTAHLGQNGKKMRTKWKKAEDITKNDYVILPSSSRFHSHSRQFKWLNFKQFFPELTNQRKRLRFTRVRKELPIRLRRSARLMRLFGYYLAEGYVFKNQTTFAFNSKEKEYINDVLTIIHDFFGITGVLHFSPNKNCCYISFYSKMLAFLFIRMFGSGARKKHIPDTLFSSTDAHLSELIKGFWRGDGSMSKVSYTMFTTSKHLAHQLHYILLRLDIIASLWITKDEYGYRIDIITPDRFKFERIINHKHSYPLKRYHWPKRIKRTDRFTYIKIRKITVENYSGNVYNLATKSNMYNVCGIIVHNCEKPLAQSLKEADEIIETCKKHNVQLAVNYSRRWSEPYIDLKLGLEELGNFISVVGIHHGPLFRTGSHVLDLFNMIISEKPLTAQAFGNPRPNYLTYEKKTDDYNINGIIGYADSEAVLISGEQKPYVLFELDVFCRRGRIRVLDNGENVEVYRNRKSNRYPDLNELQLHMTQNYCDDNPLFNAIRTLTAKYPQNLCTGEDARQTLHLALALHFSSMNGQLPILLRDVPKDYAVRSY